MSMIELRKVIPNRVTKPTIEPNVIQPPEAKSARTPPTRAKGRFVRTSASLRPLPNTMESDNTTLVDGLFTAAEIKPLVTPTSLRPAQYRPDLPMLVEQWRANFWNPEWEGAKLPREMHRFLLATFKKASEEFAEGKVAEMDGGEMEAGDVKIAVAEAGMDAPASIAAGAASADLAMPVPTTAASPGNARAARNDKDFAGWVS